ncbi:MAG TPA: sigma factor-like helix-turn-helix DNA-binding protein, partial [Acidimicrobiales bacterium]|nr:sigma factor-like helix-turn-helix DNA-binding protein [Acidimicrobiales bacterium]
MTVIEPGRSTDYTSTAGFGAFFADIEPALRRALVATFGADRGRDAAAEALAWAWEHRDRLAGLNHPLRYLYRVGQSRGRRRLVRLPFVRVGWDAPDVEPRLVPALRELSERQRVAVVLIHGYGWTYAEVADLLELTVSTVQTHAERG